MINNILHFLQFCFFIIFAVFYLQILLLMCHNIIYFYYSYVLIMFLFVNLFFELQSHILSKHAEFIAILFMLLNLLLFCLWFSVTLLSKFDCCLSHFGISGRITDLWHGEGIIFKEKSGFSREKSGKTYTALGKLREK